MNVSPSPADPSLAADVRRGDIGALTMLYERHAPAMFRVAFQLLGSAADAEDVLHDVFVGLPEAMRRYQERGALGAWLRRLVTRTALNHLRSRERRREVPIEGVSVASLPVAAQGDATLSALDLQRAVSALPDALRVVFVLREIEGHSHAEIAELLHITVAASEVRLCRAFKALRADRRDD